ARARGGRPRFGRGGRPPPPAPRGRPPPRIAPASPRPPVPSRAGPREPADRLEVALLRLRHHVRRQRGRGRLVVPAAPVQPVAYELLVERQQPAGLVLPAVPVT